MTKLLVILAKIRRAEPSWLATKRKPIAGFLTASLTGWLARTGLHLTPVELLEVASAVGAAVAYAIPNQPTAP